ncbi:hypothetical protein LCD45_14260 [Enterobacter roggenkampii]|uniref:hypothetical protein n=1 Tax=Enterobacter TaxID=547 RepID=UPI001ABEBE06|nr:hypothetical protein [Enterobacter roggenkampii]MBO4170951.1 hypothetical protein [Enterobacter roggenkampii]MCK7351597.1 hypothetical protein [Enterobacter roggenkampii]MCK7368827.1 hypothetical protein [Enterobacter roggenkampii]UOY40317.1 hypothetical protein LCD45_14260 [Enterobacter roggenkampii]
MSNIDKEWLQQKIADMEAARDEIPFGLGEDDSNTLAALRIALASLEAEPVSVFKIDHESSLIKHVKRVVSETNAQPAPVSVPAAMEMDDDFDSAFEHGKAVGWNAYRAAMLQSFGNSEQLNSPVIPDGWVMVPVDMPHEMMRAVQVNSELGAYAATNLNGAYSLFREFWDVAVTAAPQQEMNT